MRRLSTSEGVIAALAMDQRRSLRKLLAAAKGVAFDEVSDAALGEFKTAVTRVLSPLASAILLDPEYGMPAAEQRAAGCGLLLTYEADGFENPRPHRMLALMEGYSAERLRSLGADGLKVLLSWDPGGDGAANARKRELVGQIGDECEAAGVPFLLEPVVYDDSGLDPKSYEFAKRKPALVVHTIEEFSKPTYKVDILKVEFPVNARFVEGSAVFSGAKAHQWSEALDWYRAADAASRRPYVYLSAGVSNDEFVESLRMATEAGSRYSGVLCGRANWQGGAAEYARGGVAALEDWLAVEGMANTRRVNAALAGARPWTIWEADAKKL